MKKYFTLLSTVIALGSFEAQAVDVQNNFGGKATVYTRTFSFSGGNYTKITDLGGDEKRDIDMSEAFLMARENAALYNGKGHDTSFKLFVQLDNRGPYQACKIHTSSLKRDERELSLSRYTDEQIDELNHSYHLVIDWNRGVPSCTFKNKDL